MKKSSKAIPDDWTFTEHIDGPTFAAELDQLIPVYEPMFHSRAWFDLYGWDPVEQQIWHTRIVALKFKYEDLP